jgi:hypothetical protein
MLIRDQLIGKMRSLPPDKLEAVAAFVEHLESAGNDKSGLAEYGMGEYLNQLSAYEDLLAAGKIQWR